MKHNRSTYIKNILFPCFLFSMLTGIFTGILIFLFKFFSGFVLEISGELYAYVRQHPIWLPCLVLGAALLGLLASLILRHAKDCRGGGIPTAIAILRGLIEFRWAKSILHLFASASLTFLAGVPLGNEGPSVQMGTAVGRGTVRLFAKNHMAWDRYIMTGGACGGFAVATGAPLTGVFFAFEEAHRRFSPMIFLTAAMTVTSSTVTMRFLCDLLDLSPYMFDFSAAAALPLRYLWLAVLIGIFCGLLAVLFTRLYAVTGNFLTNTLKTLPFTVKIVLIFALVALSGFASGSFIGSGHDVIQDLFQGKGVWALLILCFCVRALFLMLANRAGVSGGIFVPTLTFGALIGALFSKAALQTGLLPETYYAVPLIIGMAAFLAASSRTPITAIMFAVEALSGFSNVLPITVGVTIAYLVIETCGIPSLHHVVLHQRVSAFHQGKTATVVDTRVTVMPHAFAVGKEVRDILWPPTCTVLSVDKSQPPGNAQGQDTIRSGDILHIHYQTFDPEATGQAIADIVGTQPNRNRTRTHAVDKETHIVPDL